MKQLLPVVHSIHTIDSERLAAEVSKRWSSLNHQAPLPVFLEVNIDHEPSKSGLAPDTVCGLAEHIAAKAPGLQVMGLMCIPAFDRHAEKTRAAFSALRTLEARCRSGSSGGQLAVPFPPQRSMGQLSMGMTDDYELAIAEGATHVRIGVALFGSRIKKT